MKDISAQEKKNQSYAEFLKQRSSFRYTLRPGDNIIKALIERGYEDLHGRGGAIDQTLWKNGISKKNIKKLPIGLEIKLPYNPQVETKRLRRKTKYPSKSTLAKSKNKHKRRPATTSLLKNKKQILFEDHFYLDIGYGARFFSIEQNGNLGDASVGEINPHYFNFSTGFTKGSFSYYGEYGVSQFKIRSNSKTMEEQVSFFIFGVGFHNFFLGAGIGQAPIFRNNSGSVELAKLNISEVNLGYKSVKKLRTKKETKIRWGLSFGAPVAGSTNNNNINVSDVSGYSSKLDVSFEREISKNIKNHTFYFIKQNLEYKSWSFDTDWDTSQGNVDYTGVNSSFQIGIRFEL